MLGVVFSDLMHGRLCVGAGVRRVPFTDAPRSADGVDFRFSNDGWPTTPSLPMHTHSSMEFLHRRIRERMYLYTHQHVHVSHTINNHKYAS